MPYSCCGSCGGALPVVAIRGGAAAGLLLGGALGAGTLHLGGGEGPGADGAVATHAAELVDVREVELGLGVFLVVVMRAREKRLGM